MWSKKIPALSENTTLRYANFIALYFAEGLHMGMLFVGIPAWLAMQGKTPTEIGGFAVACSLPWTFKFVAAPLMDRYAYLPMGRKRPWVIGAQLGLTASFIALAFVPDPLNNLDLLMGAAFLASFCGALQDAATDGMAVDVLADHQQARANGFMGGARMIGSSLALAAGSWILNVHGFTAAILVISAMVGLMTLVPIILREQPEEKILPWGPGTASLQNRIYQGTKWATILKSLYSVFRLRDSLLVALLMFVSMGSYNYFETLLPIFAVKITGWTNTLYSQAFATADLIGGIAGLLMGGYLIERFGKKRMIGIYFFLIMLITSALILSKSYWENSTFLYGFIIIYRWLNAFAKIGVYAIAMQCCSKKVSASQFTFYMTLGSLGSMVGATLIGPMKENFSWDVTFFLFVVFLAFAWIIMYVLDITKLTNQIEQFEVTETNQEIAVI
ncbi:MFS transporter [Dyadobacter arcticus]|uniref:PAT family beta-lactamase induction signal transducer AmpG n=1 Tax=Dyadobacter arcticus TaxID=1078754 RepID=A0ABX0US35_9BACT|nr:MFS transporter [Dyadobacter arcticus]NIJ55004.1 PAT family beta-lactamase induction signal transducer AmpG [Dyadobacter arcticus]